MDERLKFLLLLNYVNANSQALAKFAALGVPWRELWSPSKIDAAATVFTEKQLARIREAEARAWAENEAERAAKLGARIITIDDEDYPARLLDLRDAPLVLYVRGRLSAADKCVAVVGTRRASIYGKNAARSIGEACARYGVTLVSGGAFGVDCESQSACAEACGTTFAVMGTGIDVAYPASNRALFEKICERGALVTEFPIGAGGDPWHFPQRNRIVAALAEKVVVVEAPLKSGSMITARLALELGREVWAVPGRITDANAEGTNALIYDGAYPYINEKTFFSACGAQAAEDEGAARPEARAASLGDEERKIFDYLAANGEKTIDNISVAVKMSAADILKNITLMSAKGLVYMPSAGRYGVKGNL